MKKTIALFVFIFFCTTLIAQEEVTFSFSSKKNRSYSRTVTLYVNGTEAVKLKNGDIFIYKATLDVSQPITVLTKHVFDKQEITFKLAPGNKCSLETSFSGGMLNLDLLSGGKLAPGTGSKSSLLGNKKDLSISYTSEKVLASDTIRLQWLEKGGKIKGMSYIGGATFISLNNSDIKITGIGGQFTITQTYLNFKIPENKPGIRSWNSFVFGFSENFQLYGDKTTIDIKGMKPITSSSFT